MALNTEGILLVVSGPSGVGKGTIIGELMSRRPQLRKSISCTTRQPRPDETDGEDYRFVSGDEFARMREAGELLEWAVVHGETVYGTPKEPVERALAEGYDLVLEIDYQGARSVRQQLPGKSVLVFVMPPSWQELKERLMGRETESEGDVKKRLATARRELEHIDLFEYAIVNDEVQRAADALEAILVAERRRARRGKAQQMALELLAQAEAGDQ